ncbi:hypothetical protein INT45_001605 [Circinella minor]|uniref:Uncharacterized protein n=1 Tax=Circinella minor TaxID=1195481 RepID=A0A8H7RS11_9FUNG|nr:hypothetical protein INT45_001605 [Circinella minor]
MIDPLNRPKVAKNQTRPKLLESGVIDSTYDSNNGYSSSPLDVGMDTHDTMSSITSHMNVFTTDDNDVRNDEQMTIMVVMGSIETPNSQFEI